MAVSHKNIPDSELHDPKGFAGASNSTALKKSAAGALEWDSIQTADIATDAVTTPKIPDANITTAKIADDNVTPDKVSFNRITYTSGSTYNIKSSAVVTSTATLATELNPELHWVAEGDGSVQFSYQITDIGTAGGDARATIYKNSTQLFVDTTTTTTSRTNTTTVSYGDVIYLLIGKSTTGECQVDSFDINIDTMSVT